jgi:hypothetical protein
MRKSRYNVLEIDGKRLKKPIEVIIERTLDKRWKASTGTIHTIADDRNECFHALLQLIEDEQDVPKQSKR